MISAGVSLICIASLRVSQRGQGLKRRVQSLGISVEPLNIKIKAGLDDGIRRTARAIIYMLILSVNVTPIIR